LFPAPLTKPARYILTWRRTDRRLR
jgi:hypothetical protein